MVGSVNVVFCDFITGANLVEVLIDCNERRHTVEQLRPLTDTRLSATT